MQTAAAEKTWELTRQQLAQLFARTTELKRRGLSLEQALANLLEPPEALDRFSADEQPIGFEINGVRFQDSPQHYGLEPEQYLQTIESVRENLQLFMRRHYSVDAKLRDEIHAAPAQLANYVLVEFLIRGLGDKSADVRSAIVWIVLKDWGFTRTANGFTFPLAPREPRALRPFAQV